MDDYPPHSLDRNFPLLVTLGLPPGSLKVAPLEQGLKSQGVLLRCELPIIEGQQPTSLLQHLEDRDASVPGAAVDQTRRYRFRIRSAGRTFVFPPRHARLPENFEPPATPAALHSSFSPLSPSCHLYPDGIIDSKWLQKHQDMIPAQFLCFYTLTSDPTLTTLSDNKIKNDVNDFKSAVLSSGYKSRVAVVILNESSGTTTERLEQLRRGCGLSSKEFFALPSQGSDEDIGRIIDNALTMLYLQAIDYYRDLGRRSRKKKGRGFAPQPAVPPTSGTSQTLSLPGWNARYEFKFAVYAEFRQEVDVALRAFESAYEILVGPDILDAIPSWSPRWNEARMLADIVSIRCLRCLLWNGQYSAAVKRWQSHRDRICDLLERRAMGTNNYGWAAWEARWATVMANLMERVHTPDLSLNSSALFQQPEKALSADRLAPWELLHHTGYWYRSAAQHLRTRRRLAYSIPEDDRQPPDFSPASKVAGRAFTYDTYMCPEPHEEYPLDGCVGVDHGKMISGCLAMARKEFLSRQQTRLAIELAIDMAREFGMAKNWAKVYELLHPQWAEMLFRNEGWSNVTEDICWMLRMAASNLGHGETVVAIDWELLDRRYSRRQNWHYDLSKSLGEVEVEEKPTVTLETWSTASFLSGSFAFKQGEGKAGSTCPTQLALTSSANPVSAPIVITSVKVRFEGSIKPVVVHHDPAMTQEYDDGTHTAFSVAALTEVKQDDADAPAVLKAHQNLTLRPGSTVVFELAVPLRDAGENAAISLEVVVDTETFTLRQSMPVGAGHSWFISSRTRKPLARTRPQAINILPRPARMEIKPRNLSSQYYTNEPIQLDFDLLDAEDSEATVKLSTTMFGQQPGGFKLFVGEEEIDTAPGGEEESALLSVPLGVVASNKSVTCRILVEPLSIPTTYDFTLQASYRLESDPTVSISCSEKFKLKLVAPFEANYDMAAQLRPDPWPSLFDHDGVLAHGNDDDSAMAAPPRGLSQNWLLDIHYASFASEDLKVVDVHVDVPSITGLKCTTKRRSDIPTDGVQIKPKSMESAQFDIEAHKVSLDDRAPVGLELSFYIKWQRLSESSSSVNTTILPVPAFGIFGIEPRAFAIVSYPDDAPDAVVLDVVIENASNYFLTFGVGMEPSEGLGYSGAKTSTMNVLPVSKRHVTYRMKASVRGEWVRARLMVRDKYFQKVLKILPTDGVKVDQDGILIWVPPAESSEGSEE